MIGPGTQAPEFELRDQDGKLVRLADLAGQTSVLVFYPADFSPVCTDQLNVYEEVRADLEAHGCRLYGISVDGVFCHKAFQQHLGVEIPLLSDFHPKGEVCRRYGTYLEERGHATRALVMIAPDLRVSWSHQPPSPLEVPGPNLIFDALEAQRAGASS